MAGTSFKIRGIEPPDLASFPIETRKLYWGWVVELGLKAKGKEILAGLDKDGKPLKPIKPATKDHRKSAMTPSGKGDPNAPALIPGWQKSRTYSLLAGRALSTHAEFYWRYDAWTGASWGDVLAYQRKQGRDVIGISAGAIAKVKVQSWAKWEQWKAGALRQPNVAQLRQRAAAVPQIGRYAVDHAELGMTASGGSAQGVTFLPGRSTGWTTPQERAAYLRGTASASLPGRPSNPASRSPISGPRYNRLIQHTWNQGPRRGSSGTAAPVTPPPRPRTPIPSPIAKRVTAPPPKPIQETGSVVPSRDFVAAVLEAVELVPTTQLAWGDRAWTDDVWRQYEKLAGVTRMSLDAWKERVANTAALRSRMVRLDMVQVFPVERVRASDIEYKIGGRVVATFNFFRVQGGTPNWKPKS
jgi:hypothetical protein